MLWNPEELMSLVIGHNGSTLHAKMGESPTLWIVDRKGDSVDCSSITKENSIDESKFVQDIFTLLKIGTATHGHYDILDGPLQGYRVNYDSELIVMIPGQCEPGDYRLGLSFWAGVAIGALIFSLLNIALTHLI
jgi:hypothetical protein